MKRYIAQAALIAMCMFALAGCGALLASDSTSSRDQSGGNVTTGTTKKIDKSSFRLAPELNSDTWLNGTPISLKELRGQVVLVDFWTFG